VFLVLSVVIALFPNTLITTLMSLSWGAIAGSMLGPFLYGLYWKKTTVASVWASFILGVGFVVANFFGGWLAPTLASAAAILASLVIVPAVSLLSGKLPKDHIDRVFSCYKQ
jgi:SSS family solute:Na+ symporter